MWSTLEFLVGLQREDVSTYREYFKLNPMHGMLLQHYIGHCQTSWDIRTHSGVVGAFAEIYGKEATVGGVVGDNLVTSFDGCSISLPPEITGRGWEREMRWHCDQSFLRCGFETIQSWVTLYESGGSEATMHVLQGSHKLHQHISQYYRDEGMKNDYYRVNAGDAQIYNFYV